LPDPRNNPSPDAWRLKDVLFLTALGKAFNCNKQDITRVFIEARMKESDIERRTRYMHDESLFYESNWTAVKRARQ
jgi:hypothetical protein